MNEVKLITEDQLNRLMQVKGAKQLQQMYAKTKGQQGGNFAEDVGKWFQSTGKNVTIFLNVRKLFLKQVSLPNMYYHCLDLKVQQLYLLLKE